MERKELHDCLIASHNIEELKTACFKLGIDYEGINTTTIDSFARELVLYCERNNCYSMLVEYCAGKGSYNFSRATDTELRDIDFSVLSDCHATLLKLRNLFQNTLPIPHLEPQRMQQIMEFSNEALEGFPVLQRVMGKSWAEEYRDVLIEVVIASKKASGRDLNQEVRELQSHSPDEIQAFFGEFVNKTRLTELMDKLIAELEAKMS